MEIDPATISSGPITILRRGLSFYGNLTTETTAYKLDWPTNSIVMFGTDVPQIFQWLKEYIDGIAIAGSPDASTTAKGLAEEATQAEVDAGTAAGSAARLFQNPSTIRAKKYHDYAADSVGTDAYAITITPAITAYATGQVFTFKAGTANTGACTLAVSGLSAITIKKYYNSDLETGDILANQIVMVEYDGTNFQMLSVNSLSKLSFDSLNKAVGVLGDTVVKTYFNMQLPFILWTGSTSGALTTDFPNWSRSDSTDVYVPPMGMMADFQSTGTAYLSMEQPIFRIAANTPLEYNDGNVMILDFFAKFPASGTGDVSMGFGFTSSTGLLVYDSTARTCVGFVQRGSTGVVYANTTLEAVGVTNTDISSGLTLTNWNHYKFVFTQGVDTKFYVNGILKATHTTNLPNTADDVNIGFGRSNTSLFQVTAPNFSIKLI